MIYTFYSSRDDPAQVTIGDGSDTDLDVPSYSYYNYGKAHYIIPADELTAIHGKTITALKWYMTAAYHNRNYTVILSETTEDTVIELKNVSEGTVVYSGEITADSEILVTFDVPYLYGGQNLLVTVLDNTGSYGSSPHNGFIGTNKTGASCLAYRDGAAYSASEQGTATLKTFLPKTTLICGDITPSVVEYDLYIAGAPYSNYGNKATISVMNTIKTFTIRFEGTNTIGCEGNTDGMCNAAVAEYPLWMGGVQVTSKNLSGEGWNFDPESGTLTLNGYTYVGEDYQGGGDYPECGAIYTGVADLTLVVEGVNTVKETGGINGHYCSNGIVATDDLTITGSGTLNAIGGTPIPMGNGHGQSRGIRVMGTCTLAADFTGILNATGSALTNTMNTDVCHGLAAEALIVNGGTLNAAAGDNTGGQSLGIVTNSATIHGGTVAATGGVPTSGSSYGFGRTDLTINGGTVTLIGDTNAFYPYDTLTLGDGVMAVASASKTGADATAYDPSKLSTYKYIQTSYELPVITVAAPVLPAAGKFTNSKTIEINCETDGAKIYYTTDGSEPTQNSTEYTAAFTINKTTTVKAIAILNGQSSEVASVTYTKRSGGSGGGTSYHAVVAENAENGAITARPSAAAAGTVVTLTPVPKEGCTVERVIVMDKDGKEIPLTNNGDGTYHFTMPNGKVTVVATFAEIEHGAVCPSKGFSDVDPNAWYHEYVDYVVSKGLMQGVANDRFAPDITTTRAMIVTILHRLEGKPAVSGKVSFDDVEAGSWYADAVAWAEANEIVGGYGDGTFGPDDCITREQFAAILYRYAKFKGYDVSKSADLSGYADVSTISDWALPAIQWANAENLITGRTATMLVLRDNATRAEAAAILVRFLENVK